MEQRFNSIYALRVRLHPQHSAPITVYLDGLEERFAETVKAELKAPNRDMPDMADEGKLAEEALGLSQAAVSLREYAKSTIQMAGRKLLPQRVIQEIQRFRAYKGVERSLYLKIRVLTGIGLANQKGSLPTKRAHSFLFVCFGNIMRSPMCEALMTRALVAASKTQIAVRSGGLNAEPGRRAHPWAIAAARDLGIALENHRARLLTAEMVDKADVIFAMDYQNQVQLLSRYPHTKKKVFMLGFYAGESYPPIEIHDPYYGSEAGTRDCYKTLDVCIQNLVRSLSDGQ